LNNTRLNLTQYTEGIRTGDRVILAKAITLVESSLPEDQATASSLLDKILPQTGNAIRIGITGAPGVGKSTFIEALGNSLTQEGKKVAILTIDPSSQLTKGSILGDKTRMNELSKNPLAFIRPTASSSILGGVAGKTREAMLLCEAAGFEVILIETVGVGQSEVAVRNIVDFFLLLMLPGAGDELQGIKKGIMEMADAVVITKTDGAMVNRATETVADYQQAMHLLPAKTSGWTPKVLTSSALENRGINEVWKMIMTFQKKTTQSGYFDRNRKQQTKTWFLEHFDHLIKNDYLQFEGVAKKLAELVENIAQQKVSPPQAAHQLLKAYHRAVQESKS
jgi:LAO/AO transport system kinase